MIFSSSKQSNGTTELTSNLDSLQPSLILNPKIRQRFLLQRLLLGLHNIRQTDVPRLIQPQIRRNDHGQFGAQSLHTPINLPRHLNRATLILDFNLTGLRRLRPPQETSKHLTRLALVTVDSLLPDKNEVDVLLLDNALQHLGHGERLETTGLAVGDFDVEGPISTHGHRGAEGVDAFGPAGGESEDVFDVQGSLAFAQTNGFFDGEFIEWV